MITGNPAWRFIDSKDASLNIAFKKSEIQWVYPIAARIFWRGALQETPDCHRGSLLYTSPASLVSGMHEAPKDIWVIGCIVVEMITGNPAWRFLDSKDASLNIAFKKSEIQWVYPIAARIFWRGALQETPDCHRGSLLYTSPASLVSGMHEAPKDIWVIGCIVVEMITENPAWRFLDSKDASLNIAFKKSEIQWVYPIAARIFWRGALQETPVRDGLPQCC
nr:mitogen-activated protein kinase kinase kinase 2-like [Ipomoea batatas]